MPIDRPRLLVIDAQGGGFGRAIIEQVRRAFPSAHITAVGTNSIATSAMLKAGAHAAATGENAVVVCCRSADAIIGALGIGFADSMLGEITPVMAQAVAQSAAHKLLVPVSRCNVSIVGASDLPLAQAIGQTLSLLRRLFPDE